MNTKAVCRCCGEWFEPVSNESCCDGCWTDLAEALDHPQAEWKAECENDDKADLQ